MSDTAVRENQQLAVEALRARGLAMALSAPERIAWAEGFNKLPAMRHFGSTLDLGDDVVVRTVLPQVDEHHRGGLGTAAVNGAVIAGLFDCALGVAGVMQLPGKRTGTVELSIKLLRPVLGDCVDLYAVAIKRSKQIVFAEAQLFSGGRLCALGSGMVAIASTKDWAAVP